MDDLRKLDQQIAIRLGIDAIWCGDPDDGELMESECEEVVPRYSSDLNAALSLGECVLWHDDGHWNASFINDIYGSTIYANQIYRGEDKTPALAICKAWLNWKDGKN